MLQRHLLAAIVGAAALIIVGYFVYAAPGDATSFKYWLGSPVRFGAIWWAAFGGIMGVAINVLRRR